MDVVFEVSEQAEFHRVYGVVVEDFRAAGASVRISEDSIGYGVAEYLVIGAVFIYQAALSGITWDVLKAALRPFVRKLLKSVRKQDHLAIYVQDGTERIEVEIPEQFSEVDISLPDRLRIRLKK